MARSRVVLRTAGIALGLVTLLTAAGCGADPEPSVAPRPVETVTATVTSAPSVSATAAPLPEVATTAASSTPALPDVDLTRPPASYAAALAHVAAAGEPLAVDRFVTPSANIYCVVDAEALPRGCEIGEGSVRDVDVCGIDGPSQFVGRIELDSSGATAVCNTDTIRVPEPPTLDYGQAANVDDGPVTCVAERIGVTCVDRTTETGFFLRRDDYLLF